MKEILDLKVGFDNVKILRADIKNVFDTLETKLGTLKKIYSDFIQSHKQTQYMFGIDSFYFQNKLIELEYTNMLTIFDSIENRMYCEYYRMHQLVQEFVNTQVTNETVRNKVSVKKKYPGYKILEPQKQYGFGLITELQEHITNTIMELDSHRVSMESELASDAAQSKMGLNIGNLVNSYRYSNAVLNESIYMFIRYLDVFNEHHTKYFTRLLIKTKLIIGIINEDIQIKQFNPTGNTGDYVNVSRDFDLGDDQPTINRRERASIKSFVQYDQSGHGFRSALDNIVSNIPTREESLMRTQDDISRITRDDMVNNQDISMWPREHMMRRTLDDNLIRARNSTGPSREGSIMRSRENIIIRSYDDTLMAPQEEPSPEDPLIKDCIMNENHVLDNNQLIKTRLSRDDVFNETECENSLDDEQNIHIEPDNINYHEENCQVTNDDIGRRVSVVGHGYDGVLKYVGPEVGTNKIICCIELDEPPENEEEVSNDLETKYFDTQDSRTIIVERSSVDFK